MRKAKLKASDRKRINTLVEKIAKGDQGYIVIAVPNKKGDGYSLFNYCKFTGNQVLSVIDSQLDSAFGKNKVDALASLVGHTVRVVQK